MAASSLTVDVHISGDEWLSDLVAATAKGLQATPKEISPVWFYDARGSELFDAITRLPEYYLTRAERSLLTAHAGEMAALSSADTLVELGSGTSDKTRVLLDAMAATGQLARYVPFDVSEETVREAASALAAEYDGLAVHAVVGDFHRHLGTIPAHGRRLVAFLGSTVGNLAPGERHRMLSDLAATMIEGEHLLLGVDLVKDPATLLAAYDDDQGITAEFNLNALRVINERLDATFDVDSFAHVARWNPESERVEMWLRSTKAQEVEVPALDLVVSFAGGEEMRTEISSKFTESRVTAELDGAGFVTEATWSGEGQFLLVLARRASAQPA